MFSFKKSVDNSSDRQGLLARLTTGLGRTRHSLGDGIAGLLGTRKLIDADLLEQVEDILLSADVGVDVTQHISQQLNQQLSRKQLNDGVAVLDAVQQELYAVLEPCTQPLDIDDSKKPFVILMVGVNGAGKTTTIGKLAHQFTDQGRRVMLAAGDTFRAAAVEQLQTWGERNKVPVIAQGSGADSASVIYDALQSAQSRQIDVLIADTAGRLHTQSNLMEELKKVRRVLGKHGTDAPHEVLLVLDAGIGQNALIQAQEFHQAVGVTGLVLTKLDGTAKGGVIFAIANKLKLPIRYIGVGEGIEDLRPFDAASFIQALFSR